MRHAGEPRDRSAEETLERLALEPPALPDGEVAKLDGELGERRGQAGLRSPVERRQLAPQDAHRPAVRDDVVEGQEKDEDLLLEAQEDRAQEGPARDIEGEDPLRRGEACRLALRRGGRQAAQVHERQGRPPGRVDPLHGPAPGRDDARAERLVALDLRGERRRERRRRHRAAERQRERHVVARVARRELVEQPPPLLPERQRRLGAAGRPHERRCRAGRGARAAPPQPLDLRGQRRHGRVLEEEAQRQLDGERLEHPRSHLGRDERVAAQGEEVVLDSHPLQLEHLLPDPGEHLLDRAPRRNVRAALPALRRGRQGRAVHLAVGGERQPVEEHPGRRHHVAGQPLGEEGGERLRRRLGPGRRRLT